MNIYPENWKVSEDLVETFRRMLPRELSEEERRRIEDNLGRCFDRVFQASGGRSFQVSGVWGQDAADMIAAVSTAAQHVSTTFILEIALLQIQLAMLQSRVEQLESR